VAKERAYDLPLLCTELVRKGNDFSTVWTTVLKGNALVDSIPHSKHEGTRPVLKIRLITGERIVFDGEGKKFSVKVFECTMRLANRPDCALSYSTGCFVGCPRAPRVKVRRVDRICTDWLAGCPSCGQPLRFARTVLQIGDLSELQTFGCKPCSLSITTQAVLDLSGA